MKTFYLFMIVTRVAIFGRPITRSDENPCRETGRHIPIEGQIRPHRGPGQSADVLGGLQNSRKVRIWRNHDDVAEQYFSRYYFSGMEACCAARAASVTQTSL